jgi:hypothetical protein
LGNEKEANAFYKTLSPESKNQIELNLLNSLQTITNKSLRKKIADATISLFTAVMANE